MSEAIKVVLIGSLISAVVGPTILLVMNKWFSGREDFKKTLKTIDDKQDALAVEQKKLSIKQDHCAKELAEVKEGNVHSLRLGVTACEGLQQLKANGPVSDAVKLYKEYSLRK